MSDALSVESSGFDAIQDWLRDLPEGLDESARKAINRTIRQSRLPLRNALAAHVGVPAKILGQRKRVQSRNATRRGPGVLWMGLNWIPADHAGKTPSDIPGSFWINLSGQKLFIRRSTGKWAITRAPWPIEGGDQVLEQQAPKILERVRDNFEAELGNA